MGRSHGRVEAALLIRRLVGGEWDLRVELVVLEIEVEVAVIDAGAGAGDWTLKKELTTKTVERGESRPVARTLSILFLLRGLSFSKFGVSK